MESNEIMHVKFSVGSINVVMIIGSLVFGCLSGLILLLEVLTLVFHLPSYNPPLLLLD